MATRLALGTSKKLTPDLLLFGFLRHESYAGSTNRQSALFLGKSGTSIGIGLTWPLARSPALPDAPPVADTLSGFAIDTWWGLVAPAGTPREIIVKLNQAFVAALQSPETKTRFANLLAEPVANSPEEFAGFMKGELAKYEKVVKASRAKVD